MVTCIGKSVQNMCHEKDKKKRFSRLVPVARPTYMRLVFSSRFMEGVSVATLRRYLDCAPSPSTRRSSRWTRLALCVPTSAERRWRLRKSCNSWTFRRMMIHTRFPRRSTHQPPLAPHRKDSLLEHSTADTGAPYREMDHGCLVLLVVGHCAWYFTKKKGDSTVGPCVCLFSPDTAMLSWLRTGSRVKMGRGMESRESWVLGDIAAESWDLGSSARWSPALADLGFARQLSPSSHQRSSSHRMG